MIIPIVVALLIAKSKGYKLLPFFRAPAYFPIFAYEIFGLILNATVLAKNFFFIPYFSIIKSLHLGLFLIPILVYGLYKPALAGSGCILLGTLMNRLVMWANGGKMPVFPTLSRWTGYFDPAGLAVPGSIHTAGNEFTKLKFLADFIDTGFSVLSLGDLVIRIYAVLIVYWSVVRLNETKNAKNLPLRT